MFKNVLFNTAANANVTTKEGHRRADGNIRANVRKPAPEADVAAVQ